MVIRLLYDPVLKERPLVFRAPCHKVIVPEVTRFHLVVGDASID